MGQTVAVIGGGVAGLTAAHLLDRHVDVTLFERSERVGGNAYTYRTRAGEEVDIAVAAFGRAGYPTFYALLRQLGVKTDMAPSAYMSFQDLDTGHGIYVTPSIRGLLAQRFQVLRPAMLLALVSLFRELARAQALLRSGGLEGMTLEQAMAHLPGLTGDARLLFLGALCLMSSMSGAEVLASPATFFFGKLAVHHDVLSPKAVYSVRTVRGHTRAYVEALAKSIRSRIVTGARIGAVRREAAQAVLTFEDGSRRAFDRVVMACNADQALALLEDPTPDETRLLGPWRYKEGRVVLHRDHSSFPPWDLQQAYTFLYRDPGGRFETSVNGALRFEPGVSRSCDLLSSQHPNFPIAPDLVEHEVTLRTPIFDFDSMATITHLPGLNGVRGTYYCGSHFGHGLHEDAIRSAVDVARAFGGGLDS